MDFFVTLSVDNNIMIMMSYKSRCERLAAYIVFRVGQRHWFIVPSLQDWNVYKWYAFSI